MSAAEAQMHGVAVVASRTGGLTEIVQDGLTGYLVPAGDEPTLAARLDELVSAPDAARSMGIMGHVMARERFSLEGFAVRFEALYRDAVATHGGVA